MNSAIPSLLAGILLCSSAPGVQEKQSPDKAVVPSKEPLLSKASLKGSAPTGDESRSPVNNCPKIREQPEPPPAQKETGWQISKQEKFVINGKEVMKKEWEQFLKDHPERKKLLELVGKESAHQINAGKDPSSAVFYLNGKEVTQEQFRKEATNPRSLLSQHISPADFSQILNEEKGKDGQKAKNNFFSQTTTTISEEEKADSPDPEAKDTVPAASSPKQDHLKKASAADGALSKDTAPEKFDTPQEAQKESSKKEKSDSQARAIAELITQKLLSRQTGRQEKSVEIKTESPSSASIIISGKISNEELAERLKEEKGS